MKTIAAAIAALALTACGGQSQITYDAGWLESSAQAPFETIGVGDEVRSRNGKLYTLLSSARDSAARANAEPFAEETLQRLSNASTSDEMFLAELSSCAAQSNSFYLVPLESIDANLPAVALAHLRAMSAASAQNGSSSLPPQVDVSRYTATYLMVLGISAEDAAANTQLARDCISRRLTAAGGQGLIQSVTNRFNALMQRMREAGMGPPDSGFEPIGALVLYLQSDPAAAGAVAIWGMIQPRPVLNAAGVSSLDTCGFDEQTSAAPDSVISACGDLMELELTERGYYLPQMGRSGMSTSNKNASGNIVPRTRDAAKQMLEAALSDASSAGIANVLYMPMPMVTGARRSE